jgi:Pentapeptide repeats (8 copies)
VSIKRRGWSRLLIVSIIIITVSALVFISYVDRDWPEWTGFGRSIDVIDNGRGQVTVEAQPRKTLWDLLDLLIVPAILAGGAYWLQQAGKRREQYIQKQQARETTLQNYLDKMTDLLVKERILNTQLADAERSIIRSRTLTTLRRLDAVRKGIVVRFLHESGLISGDHPFIDLNEANLNHAHLRHADLKDANLFRVKLEQANLSETNLSYADLRRASLSEANLTGAILHGAQLFSTNLSKANRFEVSHW